MVETVKDQEWVADLDQYTSPEQIREMKSVDFPESSQPVVGIGNIEEEISHCKLLGCHPSSECRECKVNYLSGSLPRDKKAQHPRNRKAA